MVACPEGLTVVTDFLHDTYKPAFTVGDVPDELETATEETKGSAVELYFTLINAATVPPMTCTNHTMPESHGLADARLILVHHSDTSATDTTIIEALEPEIARCIILSTLSTFFHHHLTDAVNVLFKTHKEPLTCLTIATTRRAVAYSS